MLAEEIMTRNVQTISVSASVAAAVDALESAHVRHLPVVDDQGTLVGMISDRDLGPLMRTFIGGAEVERMPNPPEERSLTEIMSVEPIAAEMDTDVTEIIDTLVDERIGAIPVVDDADRVVGIISYIDVLNALRPKETGSSHRRRSPRRGASGAV